LREARERRIKEGEEEGKEEEKKEVFR